MHTCARTSSIDDIATRSSLAVTRGATGAADDVAAADDAVDVGL
jgi:hypothetical protein